MSELLQAVQKTARTVNRLKLHITAAVFSAVLFAVLIFPFDDLTDFASAQIALQTQGQVFAQFEGLDIAFFPKIGAEATNAHIEAAAIPFPIRAESIRIFPSVLALIKKRVEGHLSMDGFYGGRAEVRLRDGGLTDRGVPRQSLVFDTEGIQIGNLMESAKLTLPINIKGVLKLQSSGTIDPTLAEPPEFEADLGLTQFQSLPFSVDLQGMGLSVPGLKLSEVIIKGKLSKGRFEIDQVRLGKAGDDLQMTVKGGCVLKLEGGRASLGQYNFEIDLTPSPQFLRSGGNDFIGILGALMGRMDANPGRVRFTVTGEGPYSPPRFRAL